MPHVRQKSKEGKPAAEDAHPNEHHITSPSLILAALEWLKEKYCFPQKMRILDPCCGDAGPFGLACSLAFPNAFVTGLDIRQVEPPSGYYNAVLPADFLGQYALTILDGVQFDLIISNVPFSLGEHFVRRALNRFLAPQGVIVFLVPLEFQCSQGRATGIHREIPPAWFLPLGRRPSWHRYRADKKTKSNTNYRDYMFVIYEAERQNGPIKADILDWDYIEDLENRFEYDIGLIDGQWSQAAPVGATTYRQTALLEV